MYKCNSVWILEPWYHIDDIMRCIKYDVTEGLGVKFTARHWCFLSVTHVQHRYNEF